MVDDSDLEVEITTMALEVAAPNTKITRLKDGRQLVDYLTAMGSYMHRKPEGNNDVRRILLDINMPRMSGVEALKEIKNNNAFTRIPIVMFSNSGYEEDVQKCYTLGANGYIKKPIEFNVLTDYLAATTNYWLGVNLL